MQRRGGDEDRINSFALVSYIPDPLGVFLDCLRRELVSGCTARSHITILPPRTLNVSTEEATGSLNGRLNQFFPFALELTEIEVFALTSVIYLGVGHGQREMRNIHDALNSGPLNYDEPHLYHPHVTLAQDIDPAEVPALFETARRHWAEFDGPRRFEVDALTFVQNTAANRWLDLEEFPLGDPVRSSAG